jgi:hypothetical protein
MFILDVYFVFTTNLDFMEKIKHNVILAILILFFFSVSILAYSIPPTDWTDLMKYSTSYLGPNALPVPEMNDGKVLQKHNAEISTDFFWGYGDETQSLFTKFAYVFIPGRLAVSSWGVLAEHYKTTEAVRDERASLNQNTEGTTLIGDFYISTMIGVLKEKTYFPDINLEIVLKTSSSDLPKNARFMDTPGYYFNLTAGKSVFFRHSIIDEIRFSGNIGFLCYQTNTAYQNDAPLFGTKINLISGKWALENGICGYSGWLEQGDRPLVLRSKLIFHNGPLNYFVQYQHSLRDYPFKRIQTGVSLNF